MSERPLDCFALAVRDSGTRLQFLRRDAWPGNLMRTDRVEYARTWPSVAECRLWLATLAEAIREQLAGRELLIVPIHQIIGEPELVFRLREGDQ